MIRPATTDDAEAICEMVNYYAERGRMLHRSLESIYESLRDFLVCVEQDRVVGCVAISICWKDMGEIRSLAVGPDAQGKGIGRMLVQQAAEQARQIGLTRIFALTYETKFFAGVGFRVVDRELLPTKVWRDCIYCPRADACDEIAMILDLD
jgi:amino-acid N-acetyltransferase